MPSWPANPASDEGIRLCVRDSGTNDARAVKVGATRKEPMAVISAAPTGTPITKRHLRNKMFATSTTVGSVLMRPQVYGRRCKPTSPRGFQLRGVVQKFNI